MKSETNENSMNTPPVAASQSETPISYTAELHGNEIHIPELFQGTTIALAYPDGGEVIANRLNAAFRHCERFWESRVSTLERELAESNRKLASALRRENDQIVLRSLNLEQLAAAKKDSERLREVGRKLIALWDTKKGHLTSHYHYRNGNSAAEHIETLRALCITRAEIDDAMKKDEHRAK